MNTTIPRYFLIAFAVSLGLFVIANLIAVHLRSDAGLLGCLGIFDRANDDISRIGFPFQFLEEGGFAHRNIFSPAALLADVLVGLVSAVGIAFGYSSLRRRPDA